MTTKDKHQKHPPLPKPSIGFYHRCEWAIYGTTCGRIKALFEAMDEMLSGDYQLTYVDADHHREALDANIRIAEKIVYRSSCPKWNEYDDKVGFIHADVVFVNGNHYPASKQIVIIDPDKEGSLLRRIDQLTDIDLILLRNADDKPFDFLEGKIKNGTPVLMLEDVKGIAKHMENGIKSCQPTLKALILAGGESKRMKTDKSGIAYYNKVSHPIYLANLCKKLGLEAYISKQHDYKRPTVDGYEVIKDRLVALGPFGAIVSAFMLFPDAAWLVIACDLPFLDESSIRRLMKERDFTKIATAYRGKYKPFPEPLIAIYEPYAYKRFLEFLSLGYTCPRKVLINSDVKVIQAEDDKVISNVNKPSERDRAIAEIKRME